MKTLKQYIDEHFDSYDINAKCVNSNRNPKHSKQVDIDKVKKFLMGRYNASTWEEFTDNLKFGQCKKIAKTVYRKFKDMFDGFLELEVTYNKDACLECKNLGDDFFNEEPESNWVGNHFVVYRDNMIYDFSKGANSILGIYLLDKPNSKSKYNIEFSEEEYLLVDKIYHRRLL
jgi:hypothetical protein